MTKFCLVGNFAKPRNPISNLQTPNSKHQSPNSNLQTPISNLQHQTPISKQFWATGNPAKILHILKIFYGSFWGRKFCTVNSLYNFSKDLFGEMSQWGVVSGGGEFCAVNSRYISVRIFLEQWVQGEGGVVVWEKKKYSWKTNCHILLQEIIFRSGNFPNWKKKSFRRSLSDIPPISNLPNSNLQTPISKLQTPNSKLQSPISKLQSPISKLQTPVFVERPGIPQYFSS